MHDLKENQVGCLDFHCHGKRSVLFTMVLVETSWVVWTFISSTLMTFLPSLNWSDARGGREESHDFLRTTSNNETILTSASANHLCGQNSYPYPKVRKSNPLLFMEAHGKAELFSLPGNNEVTPYCLLRLYKKELTKTEG